MTIFSVAIEIYNEKIVRPLENKMENEIRVRTKNSTWMLQK